MSRQGIALLTLMFATSCASAPKVARPELEVQIPEEWGVEAVPAGEIAPGWWTDFGDDQLSSAVEEALAGNYDLVATAARVEQAAARARIAGADLKPVVSAGFTGSRRRQNFIGLPIPGSEGGVLTTRFTNFGVSLDLSWELDLWGRLSARARAALADFEASESDLAGARLSLAGQTAKAWFAIAEAAQQVALAEATVASFRSSTEQVRRRYELGLRPALDLRLSLANLAGAQAALDARRQLLDATTRQLEILRGRYPGRQIEIPEELPDTPPAVPAGLPADLVARRPDLAAAERRFAAAHQRVAAARRDLYPRISLTASGGTSTKELGDLVKGDFGVWSLLGNILQPLFQGGRLRANVDLAKATGDEALARYASAALRAYLEVESTLEAEGLLAEREAHLATAAQESRAAERLADERYRSGLEGFITVLESQRRAFQAESEWLFARRLRLENRTNLYLALGGGFQQSGQKQTAQLASQPSSQGGSE
jgi:NodT family efflux transporter outer membrane factor (OMF) lipoprotein